MNRWRSRLAELLDASSSPANLVQNVRNVQKPAGVEGFDAAGNLQRHHRATQQDAGASDS